MAYSKCRDNSRHKPFPHIYAVACYRGIHPYLETVGFPVGKRLGLYDHQTFIIIRSASNLTQRFVNGCWTHWALQRDELYMSNKEAELWRQLVTEGLSYNGETNCTKPFREMSKRFGAAWIEYLRAAWIAHCEMTDEEFCRLHGGIPIGFLHNLSLGREGPR